MPRFARLSVSPALPLPRVLAATLLGLAGVCAAQTPVSADAAAQAIARGAAVVDLRTSADYALGHLPRAVSVPEAAAAGDRDALQTLVSRHGIDLSREVVVVGQPGDGAAAHFQARLARYATGRVHWLVGGTHEWALSGRPLSTEAHTAAPVPQYLVALQPQAELPRMAGASVRDTQAVQRLAFQEKTGSSAVATGAFSYR